MASRSILVITLGPSIICFSSFAAITSGAGAGVGSTTFSTSATGITSGAFSTTGSAITSGTTGAGAS